jgi:hypothetical protein
VAVLFDSSQDLILLGSPLGGLSIEEGCIHTTIELVQVHRIEAALQALILDL